VPQGIVNYSTSRIRLYAVIWLPGDPNAILPPGRAPTPYVLDVVTAELNFRLNTIPFARISVAAGWEAVTGLAANIHYLVDVMTAQMAIQVYMQNMEVSNSFGGLPVEPWFTLPFPFLVFDGYTAGVGFQKSMSGQAGYEITINHWLSDLNFSSALTRSTNALNPSQISTSAAFADGNDIEPSFTSYTLASKLFTAKLMTADFWGQAMLPWLLKLTQQDLLIDFDDPLLADQAGKKNFEAERALNRIEPLPSTQEDGTPELNPDGTQMYQPYKYGVASGVDTTDVLDSDSAVDAIGQEICQETFDTMASTTLWDKLVGGYLPSYLLSLSPLVGRALVVPFTPGLRATWATIYTEEYDSITVGGDLPRPLRGVRLMGGIGDMQGAWGLQLGDAGASNNIGGRYDNPNVSDGMIQYVNGPSWLANIVCPSSFAADAAAPGGIVANALNPGVGAAPAQPNPAQVKQTARALFDSYAEAYYVNEVLRSRYGTLKGKLRFDIAPGSSVQVVVTEEKFVARNLAALGKLPVDSLYATVRALTVFVSREPETAYTSFELANIRSSLENTQDGTSIAAHPLWTGLWKGAPLVDQDGFTPMVPPFVGFAPGS
jgi:hypothetical protein